MITTLLASVLLATTAQAADPELSQDSQALLRCSAAFAIVSHGQSTGNADALKWPELETRGREFFVRSLAQLMDETGLDRAGISRLVQVEAQKLWNDGRIDDVMPPCLVMLNASGV